MPLLASLVLRMSVSSASVLYEDQRGSNTWLKEFLGDVNGAYLSGNSISIIHSSREMAAVNVTDGTLAWRRQVHVEWMHGSQNLDRVATISDSAVQIWSQTSGQLLWRTEAPGLVRKSACAVSDGIVFLLSGNATYVDMKTGKLLWSTLVAHDKSSLTSCVHTESGVLVVEFRRQHADVLLHHIDGRNGLIESSVQVDTPMALSMSLAVLNTTVTVVSEDSRHLCSICLQQKTASCALLPTKNIGDPILHTLDTSAAVISVPTKTSWTPFVVQPCSQPTLLPLPTSIEAVSSPFWIHQTPVVLALHHVYHTLKLWISIHNARNGDEMHRSPIHAYPAVHEDGSVSQPLQIWTHKAYDTKSQVQCASKTPVQCSGCQGVVLNAGCAGKWYDCQQACTVHKLYHISDVVQVSDESRRHVIVVSFWRSVVLGPR